MRVTTNPIFLRALADAGLTASQAMAITAAVEEAVKSKCEFDENRLRQLREDNERLRWRHPVVIPEWNDLPDKLRSQLVLVGERYTDDVHGGDFALQFYNEIRDDLRFEGEA